MEISAEKIARDDDRIRAVRPALSCILIMVCCIVAAGVCMAAETDDGWRVLSRGVFVNEKNMAYLPDAVASVWVKIVPDKGSELFSLAMARLRDARKAFRSFAYSTFLTEIDCTGNRHRALSVLFYGRDKNILHSANMKNASWEAILPGSSISLVSARICGQKVFVREPEAL